MNCCPWHSTNDCSVKTSTAELNWAASVSGKALSPTVCVASLMKGIWLIRSMAVRWGWDLPTLISMQRVSCCSDHTWGKPLCRKYSPRNCVSAVIRKKHIVSMSSQLCHATNTYQQDIGALENRGAFQKKVCLGICIWVEKYSRPLGQVKTQQIRIQSHHGA